MPKCLEQGLLEERKLWKQETAFGTLAMAIIFPRCKSEYAAFYKSSYFLRLITLQGKVDEYECELLDFQNVILCNPLKLEVTELPSASHAKEQQFSAIGQLREC